MMPQSYKINNPLYYSAFMNGLYDDFSQMKNKRSSYNIVDNSIDLNDKFQILLKHKSTNIDFLNENSYTKNLNFLIKSSIFIPYEYCAGCFKIVNTPKKLSFIDIISGFRRNLEAEYSICNMCYSKIHPKLYIIFENQTNLDNIETSNLISPVKLINEIDNIIKNHGDKYFFLNDYHNKPQHREIFWNILFYFQLLNLPTIVMALQQDIIKLRSAIEEMKNNMETIKKQSSFNISQSQQSYKTLKTITDTNSVESDNDSSDYTTPNSSYNNNEKILQSKM